MTTCSLRNLKGLKVFVLCVGQALLFAPESEAQSPAIIAQPLPLTLGPGDQAGFAVTATGAPPLAYQWYRDGAAVSGATDDLLVLPNVQTAQAGNYSVRVTNSQGAALSKDAKLTVAAYTREWIDPTFHGSAGTPLLVLPDGRVIATYDGSHPLVRLGLDGKSDPAFLFTVPDEDQDPVQYWSAVATARQEDGRILVTGSITRVTHAGTFTTGRVVRINEDGSRDRSFTPPTGTETQLAPKVLLLQSGKIIIAVADKLVRLNRDGSIDATFASATMASPTGSALSITCAAIDSAGNFWVAGENQVWRLRSNGSLDETFPRVSVGGTVGEIALTANNLGWVSVVEPTTTPYLSTYRLRRLSASGKLESNTSEIVLEIPTAIPPSFSLQADGRPIVAGAFQLSIPTVEEGRRAVHDMVVRLMSDGSVDPSFAPKGIGFHDKWLMLPDNLHALAGTMTGIVRANLSTLGVIEPPRILRVIQDRESVEAGDDVSLRVVVVGPGPIKVDGVDAVPDLNAYRLTIRDVQSAPIVNVDGAGGFASRTVSVDISPSAPRLIVPPESVVGRRGQRAAFTGVVRGSYPISFKWSKNGELIEGAWLDANHRGPIEFVRAIESADDAGTYTLRVTNSLGSVDQDATLTVGPTSELANLSVRAEAGTGERVIIVGFVAKNRKQLLIQAIGPELQNYGVTNWLQDPHARLISADGNQTSNDDARVYYLPWGDPLYARLGATTLYSEVTKSSELRPEVPGGVNSVIVSGVGGSSGVALAQIFDADDSTNRLVNLSARVFAGTESATAITGFIVRGDAPKKVLIRCVGPGLLAAGVAKPLLDPSLRLVDQATHLTIATNDDWDKGNDSAVLRSIMSSVGAFPLAAGSKDSAIVATLPPGAYSAVVGGTETTTGIVLLEVYDVP